MIGKKRELRRREVADRLGCSVMQVMRFEEAGRLTPRRESTPGGRIEHVWHDPDQVAALQKEWKPHRTSKRKADARMAAANSRGKVAAVAFRMFDEQRAAGRSPDMRPIVIAAEADPALVRQLYEEWKLGLEDKRREDERLERERQEREEQRRADFLESRRQYWAMRERVARIEADTLRRVGKVSGGGGVRGGGEGER